MNPEENKAPEGNMNAPQGGQMSEGDHNTLMGVLSYIGILVLVPMFTVKGNPFVKFHVKQGLALFAAEVASWVLSMILPMIAGLFGLLNLVLFAFSIVGIVNVVKKRENQVPIFGKYAYIFDKWVK